MQAEDVVREKWSLQPLLVRQALELALVDYLNARVVRIHTSEAQAHDDSLGLGGTLGTPDVIPTKAGRHDPQQSCSRHKQVISGLRPNHRQPPDVCHPKQPATQGAV